MRYLGGKSRVAPRFGNVLKRHLSHRFVEPFVGGCNLLPVVGDFFPAECSDIHPGVPRFWAAVRDGWQPPESLSEDRYEQLRERLDWDDPETTFAAFGCSFAGKEWGGYARCRDANDPRYRDGFAATACRFVLRKAEFLGSATFTRRSYLDTPVRRGDLVYCDPPYANTTGYRVGGFDYRQFVLWCEAQAAAGATVFVSEFTVPQRPGWRVVWQRARKTTTGFERHERAELLLQVTRN